MGRLQIMLVYNKGKSTKINQIANYFFSTNVTLL